MKTRHRWAIKTGKVKLACGMLQFECRILCDGLEVWTSQPFEFKSDAVQNARNKVAELKRTGF